MMGVSAAFASSLPLPEAQGTVAGGPDGPLAYRYWAAAAPVRGTLALVHGIGSHGACFRGLAAALAPRGWQIYALDLPGHGLSPGNRGGLRDWAMFRDALLGFLAWLRQRHGDQPLLLLGHSMGGTVLLELALRQPAALQSLDVRGLIVCNPALDPDAAAPWRLQLARLLSRLWPGFALETGIAPERASRDPEVLAERAADPLRHNRCTARLGTEFLAASAAVVAGAAQLRLPLLMQQSGADRVTPAAAARAFFAAAGSAEKQWKDYPQSLHELYDDLDREQVIADLAAWLEAYGL
jgi:alpha-beta hydrolase superfamily lysophospholipase